MKMSLAKKHNFAFFNLRNAHHFSEQIVYHAERNLTLEKSSDGKIRSYYYYSSSGVDSILLTPGGVHLTSIYSFEKFKIKLIAESHPEFIN